MALMHFKTTVVVQFSFGNGRMILKPKKTDLEHDDSYYRTCSR